MFLQIFSIVIIIQGIFAQNCQLTADNMDKKWIYATKPTATTWNVLHTDYVEDQQRLYLICNEMTKDRVKFCNRGTWEENRQQITCPRRIKANVVMIENENSCSQLKGEFYQIRYTLPDGSIIPLYEVCYSTKNEQALYSRHKTYGFNLTASTNYERPMFSRSNIVSRERENSFKAENIYNTFVRLLGSNQTYVSNAKTLILERGHLANSQDFPTYDQMDETFKYVNVMPQFRGSNRSNWKRIENWIHKLPAKNTYAEVVTGTDGILSLPHSKWNIQVPMYLMSDSKNPIPMWLYKVVKYDGKCYVFATLNNEFNTNAAISPRFCSSTTCPNGLQFNTAPNSGVSYCCDYNFAVSKLGSHVALCKSASSHLTRFFNHIFG